MKYIKNQNGEYEIRVRDFETTYNFKKQISNEYVEFIRTQAYFGTTPHTYSDVYSIRILKGVSYCIEISDDAKQIIEHGWEYSKKIKKNFKISGVSNKMDFEDYIEMLHTENLRKESIDNILN